MRLKIDMEIKPLYVKLLIAEIIAFLLSFSIVFVFNNYIWRVQTLCHWTYKLGIFPSIVLWLSVNALTISIYAGLKSFKFIFLQIGVNVATYLLFCLCYSGKITGFVAMSTDKTGLIILFSVILAMSGVSCFIRMIITVKHILKRKFFKRWALLIF